MVFDKTFKCAIAGKCYKVYLVIMSMWSTQLPVSVVSCSMLGQTLLLKKDFANIKVM